MDEGSNLKDQPRWQDDGVEPLGSSPPPWTGMDKTRGSSVGKMELSDNQARYLLLTQYTRKKLIERILFTAKTTQTASCNPSGSQGCNQHKQFDPESDRVSNTIFLQTFCGTYWAVYMVH